MGAARVAGRVALFAAANVIGNPIRMAQGMPPKLMLPRTPAQQAESARRNGAARMERDRQHAIARHLAGKKQEPVVARKLREYEAATGSLPAWFIEGAGSTTQH